MEGMYEKLYHMLFNAYSDCLEALEDHEFAKAYSILLKAQRDCEEVYASWEEDPAPGRRTLLHSWEEDPAPSP